VRQGGGGGGVMKVRKRDEEIYQTIALLFFFLDSGTHTRSARGPLDLKALSATMLYGAGQTASSMIALINGADSMASCHDPGCNDGILIT
jgi:hypothetical protein